MHIQTAILGFLHKRRILLSSLLVAGGLVGSLLAGAPGGDLEKQRPHWRE
jgi:hypothetical protein